MAIRIRSVNGKVIALCAALSKPEEGDVYLDDSVHHALTTKFGLDFYSEGLLTNPLCDERLIPLMKDAQNGLLS